MKKDKNPTQMFLKRNFVEELRPSKSSKDEGHLHQEGDSLMAQEAE